MMWRIYYKGAVIKMMCIDMKKKSRSVEQMYTNMSVDFWQRFKDNAVMREYSFQ